VDSLDDLLRRCADQAARYRVPEQMTALTASSLQRMPAAARARSGTRALVDAIVRIAAQHRPCLGECGTCEAISNGLAVALGVIRAEVDAVLSHRFGANPDRRCG
jgi:hypothetical protein